MRYALFLIDVCCRMCQEQGHRAYFKETLEVTKCHQDVLHGNDKGLLLKYVATYAPKFSDSFAREWLNDEASAFSVARRVLFDYQPAEPEMWLYLFAQQFPPCRYGGTMYPLLVPWPGMDVAPPLVTAYEECEWRRADMSFLEFCRKSNKEGEIAQWVKRRFHATPEAANIEDTVQAKREALEAFANGCSMKGEKLVAADMLSIYNDRWFGQWLVLRKPFKRMEELRDLDVVEKAWHVSEVLSSLSSWLWLWFHSRLQVPPQYKHFANAIHQCPEYWDDEDAIKADLELEATGNDKAETFLAMVRAQRALVEQFVSGALDKADDAGMQAAMVDLGLAEGEEDPMFQGMELNREQRRLEKAMCKHLDRAKKGRLAANQVEWEAVVEDAHANATPIFVTGPPGTGKSTVMDKCVRRCLRDGGRVLYALPTAQQAARVRGKHPEADVDTCSGAFFLHRDAVEVMDCLTSYDMVAIDEISQLSQSDFERIIQMWETADKVPALLLAGDFWQLPGVDPSKATDSPRWNMVYQVNLHQMWRCKDETLKAKLLVLRTAQPNKRQLNDICRGHKAWTGHHEPTAWDLQELYRGHPKTTIATCTRRGAAHVNDLAIWVLFTTRKKRALAELPVDWEANPDNYDQDNESTRARMSCFTYFSKRACRHI